jgi:hypothetical protein
MPRTYSITFQPGDEIVHVIAKNFNPVNRAEFNPGVENAPCNRPLITYTYKIVTIKASAGNIEYFYFFLSYA